MANSEAACHMASVIFYCLTECCVWVYLGGLWHCGEGVCISQMLWMGVKLINIIELFVCSARGSRRCWVGEQTNLACKEKNLRKLGR